MRALHFVGASLVALAASTAAVAAPSVWSVNGHTYDYISAPNITWEAAQAAAAALGEGWHLATVTSAEENTFISGLTSNVAWLGGSDAATEGAWTWVVGPEAGTTLTYTNWLTNEPNNSGDVENYLAINESGKVLGGWNDMASLSTAPYSLVNGYVVEQSVTAVPEPETYAMMLAGLGALGFMAKRRREQQG